MQGRLGIVLMIGVLSSGLGKAGVPEPRDIHGARWARLSDRAQIELIVDELRGTAAIGDGTGKTPAQKVAGTPASGSVAATVLRDGSHATVTTPRGERLDLEKRDGLWTVMSGTVAAETTTPLSDSLRSGGASVGATFIPEPVSREFAIDRLSRDVTQSRLNRALFSTPEKTAAWYHARYTSTAPYVNATYVQFVTDPGWNRIVYGNLNRWIRSLSVAGPSAIAIDPDGRVFIGERETNAIAVYRLAGEGDQTQLQFSWRIADVTATDIAVDDRGTPLSTDDDVLYVADAVHHQVHRYNLGTGSAFLASSWGGFDSPSVIAIGKRNGASNGILYVVDRIGRRIRSYDTHGGRLTLLSSYAGEYSRYFKSLKVDHFGGVYAVDNTRNEILKFTSSLELLDTAGEGEFDALAAVEIPFGRIDIEGESPVWAGFDQLFAVERWSVRGGAQRRSLGIRLKNILFSTDEDRSLLANSFVMTDAADVLVRVMQEDGRAVRTIASSWMVAGNKAIVWDRRDEEGRYVGPGAYRYEIVARSPYRDQATTSVSTLTLPLYYHEDCGSARVTDDAHAVQGRPVRWGTLASESARQDAQTVLYRFTGLKPGSAYEVAAEFGAGDDVERVQVLTVNGQLLHEPLTAGSGPVRTGYIPLPVGSVIQGAVVIAAERRAGPDVSVTQLWLKESGQGISTRPLDSSVPTAYALQQNYPNPFNPATTIRFSLPEAGQVALKVYTITGQEVATLVNDYRDAGTYSVLFDAAREGKSLSSGVYFYRLIAGNFTAARKLILLK
jgi:hypothetical protein